MPIYVYAPDGDQDSASVGSRSCCFFEYLHVPGTASAAPLSCCPQCGGAVRRVPARFASSLSQKTETGSALRRAGQADFAEAWDEAAARREKAHAASAVRPLAEQEPDGEATATADRPALRVAESLRHHVCTADCTHGPLARRA